MCRNLAFAATALCLIGASAQAARPASPPPTLPGAAAPAPPQPAQQPPPAPPPVKMTATERAEAARMDPLARAALWSHAVEIDARDLDAGVKLAKALRELGRYDDALAATDSVLVIDPNNLEGLLESARTRIAQGQGFFAIDPAQRAQAAAPKDWRPVSLLAIALEQAQRDDEALVAHQRALTLAPNNPAMLSNLAMYFAAHGQSADAETLLRRAVEMPGATAQVRQNLALILGLAGHVDEAERLARHDLPPNVVANNIAYLRPAPTAAPERSWASVRGAP